ncbi:MAG TPA: SAF domain-containing protein [Aeromicrobium sp.]|nr:SAF domain-containing protein [Aeromicrobium sp.]
MNSRVVAAIAAAVLALLGLVTAYLYASGANNRAFDNAAMVTVYEVVKPIPADTDGAELGDSVQKTELPQKAVADGIVTNLASVAGKRTTVPLLPGEQLIAARFDKNGSSGAGGGGSVPSKLQEISLAMDAAAAGGGSVKEGTRVGMLVTLTPAGENAVPMTRMFLQDILVTGVTGAAEGGGGIVTFAVTGTQATQIAAAAQGGQIRLTAQNAKTEKDGGKPVDARNLVK